MNSNNDTALSSLSVDSARVHVLVDRPSLGRAAAKHVETAIVDRQRQAGVARVVFAAAPSQDEFLQALVESTEINWSNVIGFHMDEYLGLGADHPASFRRYLNDRLFGKVGFKNENLRLIPGERADRPSEVCLAYENLLRAEPPDIVCAGIGENGHLAFNDPPVADFLDPLLVKVVRLDAACRLQQVHDGCFPRLEDVPTHAYTLTIPALLSAPTISVVVPGPRKAPAVLSAMRGPISELCPASSLRTHPGATLFLDGESSRFLF
jgi:glucosamine-6-phosphate deaminase